MISFSIEKERKSRLLPKVGDLFYVNNNLDCIYICVSKTVGEKVFSSNNIINPVYGVSLNDGTLHFSSSSNSFTILEQIEPLKLKEKLYD